MSGFFDVETTLYCALRKSFISGSKHFL